MRMERIKRIKSNSTANRVNQMNRTNTYTNRVNISPIRVNRMNIDMHICPICSANRFDLLSESQACRANGANQIELIKWIKSSSTVNRVNQVNQVNRTNICIKRVNICLIRVNRKNIDMHICPICPICSANWFDLLSESQACRANGANQESNQIKLVIHPIPRCKYYKYLRIGWIMQIKMLDLPIIIFKRCSRYLCNFIFLKQSTFVS